MQDATTPLSELSGQLSLADYRKSREHVFPSATALEWFVRKHRPHLIEAGALVMWRGQWFARPAQFDAFVLDVMKADALRKGGVSA